MTGFKSKKAAALDEEGMYLVHHTKRKDYQGEEHMSREAMKQALEALEQVTKELLAVRDELAERGARPTTNVFHQRLWDSSFSAYTDNAIPAARSLRQAIEQAEKQSPFAWCIESEDSADWCFAKTKEGVKSNSVLMDEDCIKTKPFPLYTTPQPQEFVCSTGLCHFTLTQTNVGIGERGMEAYEEAKKRGWVGLSDERLMEMPQRTWVGLDEQDFSAINQSCLTKLEAATSAESILKDKNT